MQILGEQLEFHTNVNTWYDCSDDGLNNIYISKFQDICILGVTSPTVVWTLPSNVNPYLSNSHQEMRVLPITQDTNPAYRHIMAALSQNAQ